MSISDHALNVDFPDFQHVILELRKSNTAFRELSDQYDKLDKKIRGLEVREVPTDDQHFNEMKVERAHLKDQLYRQLSNRS
ncbi:YdcH family protein [Marinobacter sp. SS21]|uniref:YdcH family protein n=1 Tax=Marinobacter sp. SS21 TaxID=2979460 RepID=UPI00232FF03B|nr:YdcH family protein [Marinobacter sp. SS21]MDC0661276.1 YdcH family protein [Marinobacter sp. SS21]